MQSADGSKCESCPSGTVKTPDSDSVATAQCLPATTQCGNAQFAYYGRCADCSYGQIRSCDGAGCVPCASGTIKIPDFDNVTYADCVAAVSACGNAQFSYYGRCANCGYGAVQSADGSTCTSCPSGTVKVPDSDSVAAAQCLPATTQCGNAQFSYYGRCANCGYGAVQSADGSTCTSCASGLIKVPDQDNVATAMCLPATTQCGNAQFAYYGRCANCGYGAVQNALGDGCMSCDAGLVKVPDQDNVATAECLAATSQCSSTQFAYYGRCANCPDGQISNADGTGCVSA